ncbi:uncharacterized protein LOC110095510 isoform X2 [Dendrobium catenatum]|uniref:uncharacterized protein LOC110095510 isoform X2 n=1 Tax=Dendrobium catenatum TaxID=906689 RepID=UPI0010A0417F|nr:uncharacterized protein LOC110095510 isoform X2 [Dendrobium catenatum]
MRIKVNMVNIDYYEWLYKIKLNKKVEVFWWRLGKGAIPTNQFLKHRRIAVNDHCARGCNVVESFEHIMVQCKYMIDVIIQMRRWGISIPVFQTLEGCLQGLKSLSSRDNGIVKIYCTIVYLSWKNRNDFKHGNSVLPCYMIAVNALSLAATKFSLHLSNWGTSLLRESRESWCPPPKDWMKINVDASLLRSNCSGIGGIFRDYKGRFIIAFGENKIHWDIAQLELEAVFSVREYIKSWMLEYKGVIIESDNLDIITFIQDSLKKNNWLFDRWPGLAGNYPRGNKELKGAYFSTHGPQDTMSWFSSHGVDLKIEEDGRVFPVSNTSASIVDCLLGEAKERGVQLHTGKVISSASITCKGKFNLKMEKRTIDYVEDIEVDFLLIATGNNQQGYQLAVQLGHSIVQPMPSIFTFKIEDTKLQSLSGITLPKVKARLKLENIYKNQPEYTQVGPMLVTHWGLSGPVILRLSAWGARDLFLTEYKGFLYIDFIPDIHVEDLKVILSQHRDHMAKQQLSNSFPSEFGLAKRFWGYLLDREGLDGDQLWASIANKSLNSIALLLKQCSFKVIGKGQFKEEFVTSGGVPLSEITLSNMQSRIRRNLFFAGEVLNVDGVTGGFNFQNAWTGGYIAGTSIGELASSYNQQVGVV